MSAPTPAPRKVEGKKPIPAPRTLIPIQTEQTSSESSYEEQEPMDGKTTFSRKVRSISNVSKQLADDIGSKMQETVESTRQSMRRITKRFTTNFSDESEVEGASQMEYVENEDLNMFNSIHFDSPLRTPTSPIYSNTSEPDEYYERPPPTYPPPPLREEVYDQPQSLASGSTNSSEGGATKKVHENYESVYPSYPYNSDSESCVDMTAGTLDRSVTLSRSESWVLYDSVQEPVYNNVDNTPVLPAVKEEIPSPKLFMRNNSCYENHSITFDNRSVVTPSVLMEFDPLQNNNDAASMTGRSDLNELEKSLQGELYGNISIDNISLFDEASDEETYINPPPPPPPIRFDSLSEESQSNNENSRTNWFIDGDHVETTKSEGRAHAWLNKAQNLLKKAPEIVELVKGFKNKDNVIQRPTLSPRGIIQQKGMLYKITSGPVEDLFGEFSSRWCVLQSGTFIAYSDTMSDNIKENIPMDSIISIQILQEQKHKHKCENEELHSFELNVAGKLRDKHIFGTKSFSERRVWMQKLSENLTSRFLPKVTSDFTRFGWTYMKEGLHGQWVGAWLVLSKRELIFAKDNLPTNTLDLRKARCFKLEAVQDFSNTPSTTDRGPNLVIHFTFGTYYFRMWTQKETKAWCRIIKLSAQNNGPSLEQQQLTKNSIPVIVEKCVNFVYVYGSMTEGIYRRAGSNSIISDIITLFRTDAWSVQLTHKYSVHDVATALKRFFRDLVEPLIDNKKIEYLYQVSKVKDKNEKIRMFRNIFDQSQGEDVSVSMNTTKFLLGHLHFISTQSNKNLMHVDNLAAVWAPTLLHQDGGDKTGKDHTIITELIRLYKDIFPEDNKEIEQEMKMLSVLEKYNQSPQGAVNVKSSGDFRVWVYDFSKEGKTRNILIGPHKTAYEIICEVGLDLKIPVNELVLEESVLNGSLCRPLHHKAKVLDVVLKWGYWDDNDRKDNCLIINKISKYFEILNNNSLPLQAELKFADHKSKNMKPFMFEFLQAKLVQYKDKSCSNKLDSWNIEDIAWYFGNEVKRNVPTKHTITFLRKTDTPTRSKSSPWFGNVLSWNDISLRALWLSSMWNAEHPNDIMPPPQHVNLMSG
ncbi:PREDICTED: arf-GAP with Rho-GAP domain, ANK repeat and PH domain-containing protein 2 [Nicrophorus vespilloides]|uniref:Arf-GAP with Rho-GAP domain, ANK repeat and PH domain-containing protein 2 n=1 Tax=Nicrophorus vespilloides TaxID=110193 RepID=A0ABM1MFG7_NICVS|nr:PREDICTED: arf-GAP with Rho-GAP domain, ANK repeat and PH domain-containing protein 2 [Nicrophorus vespilloides]